MATVNELKITALLAATGASPPITINELEILWLTDVQGYSGTLNEMWIQEFLDGGAVQGPWNQMAYEYLGINGAFADTLTERWYQFWLAGGAGGATLISDTDAVAALWTERGTNTVTDASNFVEIENVDDDGGCYLRLSSANTILSEALVDGTIYRIIFQSKTAGVYYMGLTSDISNKVMRAGLNGADFKPLGSTDLAASFLNISLPEGVGQIEALNNDIRVFKL